MSYYDIYKEVILEFGHSANNADSCWKSADRKITARGFIRLAFHSTPRFLNHLAGKYGLTESCLWQIFSAKLLRISVGQIDTYRRR